MAHGIAPVRSPVNGGPEIGLGTGEWRSWAALLQSDFPSHWNVVVFNMAGSDGPSWVMLDAMVERVDGATLEVRQSASHELLAYFVIDTTPPEQRTFC